jgi:hypothetical protein
VSGATIAETPFTRLRVHAGVLTRCTKYTTKSKAGKFAKLIGLNQSLTACGSPLATKEKHGATFDAVFTRTTTTFTQMELPENH